MSSGLCLLLDVSGPPQDPNLYFRMDHSPEWMTPGRLEQRANAWAQACLRYGQSPRLTTFQHDPVRAAVQTKAGFRQLPAFEPR